MRPSAVWLSPTLVRQMVFDEVERATAHGYRARLTTVYDRLGLREGQVAPTMIRRLFFDALTGRATESPEEFLIRIGVPTRLVERDGAPVEDAVEVAKRNDWLGQDRWPERLAAATRVLERAA